MMHHDRPVSAVAPPEQIRYANLLFYGCWGAIFLLFLTYFLYVSGIIEPHVPLKEISSYWSQGVHHYVEQANAPTGWSWVRSLHRGDFLNFLGISVLAGLTIVGYLTLFLAYLRQGDKLFVFIVGMEALVLILAASGILVAGH